MKDTTKKLNQIELEKKRLRKDLGLIILLGSLLVSADYIDYKNSFKDEGLNEVYVLDEEETYDNQISYKEYNLKYDIKRDPFLPSEDSESFVKRTIKNDNLVRSLRKKR